MQKVKNYGSFLQAFALKKTVESFNNKCEFIDIINGEKLKGYERSAFFYFKKAKKRFFGRNIFRKIMNHYQYNKYFGLYLDMLGVNNHFSDYFDLVIIGSDEVFNIAQYSPWGFTAQLFGDITNAKRIISYAGSFGNTTMEIIKKYHLEEKIASEMKKLSVISVRDDNSKNIVKSLLNVEPLLNIDPVLFFNFNKYIEPIDLKNYILIYSYPSRMNNKDEIYNIKKTAKKLNKKIISIGFYFEWCDRTIIPNPFEALSYFINADYIITDTFHGSILSIKYNKQFAVFIRDSNYNKLSFLFRSLELNDRIISNPEELDNILFREIDYTSINETIAMENEKSHEFFRSYVSLF
jgi:hypothetical protein